MRKLLFPVILLFALLCSYSNQLLAQNDLNQKLMMGYQGWFLCKGDNAAPNEWRHWFQSLTDPSIAQLNVDNWPDMSEYTTTYATSMNYPNGSNARLFSSHDASTTNLHFKWMQDYNVYGVYLQRFLGEAVNDNRFFQVRNNVLNNVINASSTYGRHFAIMYDISGVPDDGNLYSKLVNDWEYLVNTYNVANRTGYVKQEGRPVIAIWGIGFRDRGLKPETFEQLINYFHNTAAPQYRAYVVGGVPDSWRTLNNDSESDPRWTGVYHSLDMISPWAVGRYTNVTEADNWKTNKIIPDMNDCNANGVDYMPVIFPGFSWFNMHNGERPLNQIPRAGGNFYWRQAYNAISAGSKFVYVAMFDEVDEGTAMFKLAATNAQAPAGASLVTLDEDGQSLPSDWYLRLANETQKMLSGTAPLSPTIPISPNGNAPVITSSGAATGTVGTAFGYNITATNSPTSYAASGLPSGLSVNANTGLISGTPTTSGTFNANISASNTSGTGSRALTITINATQSPYQGIIRAIPGTIQAEDFDNGGEGVAYHDTDVANLGGQYRPSERVDIETCAEGGFNVGWMRSGEWMEYTVNITTSGSYRVDLRVATALSGRTLHLEVDGVNVTGPITLPNTNSWQSWQTVSATIASLSPGNRILRIAIDSDDFNLNSITFVALGGQPPVITSAGTASAAAGSPFTYNITATNNPTSHGATGLPTGLSVNTSTGLISGTVAAPGTYNATISATNSSGSGTKALVITINNSSQSAYPNGTPWPVPGVIEAENFDTGGEGVAYHDNDALNAGGQGRTSDGVDTETCSEGGLNIGWTASGEWLEYTVNVSASAAYQIEVRASSIFSGGTMHIEFNGVDKTGLITMTNTGAWQTWATVTRQVSLNAGVQVMRIFLDNANYNINKVTISQIIEVPPNITVSPTSANVNVGSTVQLTANLTTPQTSVAWNSSNPSVATVNSNGLVTGVAVGTATITATRADNGRTATSAISVQTVSDPTGVITCYRAPGAMTINGQLTESGWKVTRTFSKAVSGSPNNTATFGVLWDNSNLYIGARILDANLFSDSSNPWDDDAVEIYIDANNNKLNSYDGLDNQIIKNYNKSPVFTKFALSGLQHGWAAVSGGYSIEIAVPWSSLGISPTASTVIGFDIGYDDDDNGAGREHQAVWNGTIDNWQNTSAFGSLRLNSIISSGRVATDVEDNDENSALVSVSPNPVNSGFVKILIPDSDGSVPMQLMNINGQILQYKVLTEKEEIIHLENVSSGLHLMMFQFKNRMIVKKLWVE